eukprot:GABV01006382.1.p1 GENE.GABV01006382.1~~GABV01006382.1.p1  ORF type:complete len:100 (-),score=11.16 GABV01006382.1:3-302(-)
MNSSCRSTSKAPPKTTFFCPPNALTADTLLLLIQGSDAVRAGQWARSVCLNDCLAAGSILPYLSRAEGQGVGHDRLQSKSQRRTRPQTTKRKRKKSLDA